MRRVMQALVVAAGLSACGGGGDSSRAAAAQSAAKPGSASSRCPTTDAVATAAGFPVTPSATQGDPDTWLICQYELTGRNRGTFLEIEVLPASGADSIFAKIADWTKGMNGIDAKPDRITVGEGGWAFGSGSSSHAAAVVGGRVYHAYMDYLFSTTIGDQKEAMVRLVELAMR
jgi:hypothetical protein